jgi:hypothetical protein
MKGSSFFVLLNRFIPDEHHFRTGIVKKEGICKTMLQECTKGKAYLRHERTDKKKWGGENGQ